MKELLSAITDGVMTKVGNGSSVSHYQPMVFRCNLVQRRTKARVVSPLTEFAVLFSSRSHISLTPYVLLLQVVYAEGLGHRLESN